MPPTDYNSYQDLAYEKLRDGIVYASYKPGTRHSVKELCDDLGLGRTPVRESLVRLSQEGLVYTEPQSGTFVSPIDLKAAEDARFVRECLEMEVAVECCSRLDERSYRALDENLAETDAAIVNKDELVFFRSDNRFHSILFHAAGRDNLWAWLDSIAVSLNRFRWLSACTEQLDWQVILDQHVAIADAIVNRDPAEARYLTSLHLHKMLGDRKAVIERFPEFFSPEELEGL